jgi:hypothetical protein
VGFGCVVWVSSGVPTFKPTRFVRLESFQCLFRLRAAILPFLWAGWIAWLWGVFFRGYDIDSCSGEFLDVVIFFVEASSNGISLESCHACMHARTHSHGISLNLLVTCVRCSAKHRGRLRNAPTLCYLPPAACHVRDEDATHKSQRGNVGGERNGFLLQ